MMRTIHDKIHGKTIELDEDRGVVDGREVEVQVTIIDPSRKWGRWHPWLGRRVVELPGNGCHHGADFRGPEIGAAASMGDE